MRDYQSLNNDVFDMLMLSNRMASFDEPQRKAAEVLRRVFLQAYSPGQCHTRVSAPSRACLHRPAREHRPALLVSGWGLVEPSTKTEHADLALLEPYLPSSTKEIQVMLGEEQITLSTLASQLHQFTWTTVPSKP